MDRYLILNYVVEAEYFGNRKDFISHRPNQWDAREKAAEEAKKLAADNKLPAVGVVVDLFLFDGPDTRDPVVFVITAFPE